MEHTVYLAYGSNLDPAQMALRCPDAKPLGSGTITGWRLAFRGAQRGYYLTLLPAPGEALPVGLWSVTPEDLSRLDEYEGWPDFYYKTTVTVPGTGPALAYIMREDYPGYGPGLPTDEYFNGCLAGFKAFGLDPAPLYQALREAEGL